VALGWRVVERDIGDGEDAAVMMRYL